jgi:hypothetical protein
MSIELYRDKTHACVMFSDLVEDGGQSVQANQFLIMDHDEGAILDPGGNLAFNELFLTMGRYFAPHFTKVGKTEDRIIGVPDAGALLPLGQTKLVILPALHGVEHDPAFVGAHGQAARHPIDCAAAWRSHWWGESHQRLFRLARNPDVRGRFVR